MSTPTARRAAMAGACAALLFVVYTATLAPDVTFWDAGEFIAAAHSLGIPHPPGTPLFVIVLHAWASVFGALRYAVATNLFSAFCTAAAGGLSAWFVARATGDGWAAAAAALVAGCMTSVWMNATETEVYSAALLLSVVGIVAAERAGRTGERRWLLLTAYLVALTVPLHLSALVAAPVLVYLVARRPGEWRWAWESIDWSAGLAISGVAIIAAAVSRLSPWLGIVGVLVVLVAAWHPERAAERHPERASSRHPERASSRHPERAEQARDLLAEARSGQGEEVPQSLRSFGMTRTSLRSFGMTGLGLPTLAVTVVGLSALAYLVIRALHDPLVNQGNPATMSQLGYVVARRQYDLAPLWPRRAPLWAQIANWFEYADWQTALSLGPTVIPTVARVAATVVCALVALAGARWHRALDRRTWWAVLLLFVCGSLGVIVYLNMRPSPSFGWGVLPATITREARERDYFFVLSFWAWGLWAGMGAVYLARRFRWHPAAGLAVAMLPIALNWKAVSRREQPEASEAREFATVLLGAAPPHAVLFVAGDNDSYPLWYLQDALGVRRDVTTVTTPLLAAPWYAAELQRRFGLGPARPVAIRPQPIDRYAAERAIADAARAQGRPVAAALTLPASERATLGSGWRVTGMVAVADPALLPGAGQATGSRGGLAIDTAATRAWAAQIAGWRRGRPIAESVDPVNEYFGKVLECPRQILDSARVPGVRASLDTLCNF